MRSVVYTRAGAASVLHLVEREPVEPATGEVRIRVAVSGVNPTDWKSRQSTEPLPYPEVVPNLDAGGIIDAVGDGVTRFAVGDRVWVFLAAHEREHGGTAQEFVTLQAQRVVPLPDGVDFDIAASLGVPAMTAHRALTVMEDGPSRLSPGALDGTVVLVAGGAGAVGHAAIQLAVWAGATVITTISGEAKAELARSAGAHHIVNYRDADAAEQIRRIAPDGVHLVVEVAAAKNAELDAAVIRPRGTVAIYGVDGGGTFTPDLRASMGLNIRYQFVLLYTVGDVALAAAAEDITAAAIDGALGVGDAAGLPLLRFTLDQTAAAHEAVENDAVGKVLIDVDPALN